MEQYFEPTQYLRVIGSLYPDFRLRLRPGYLTARPPWSDRQGESSLRAELYDEAGSPLGSFPLRLFELCLEGSSGEGQPQAVRGFVPFHPRARRVQFTYQGNLIYELLRSDSAPRAELTWQPAERVDGQHSVSWKGDHPEGLPVQFFLRYSHDGGQTWNRIGERTEDHEQTVDFDQLPGGDRCLLALVATDGINTAIAESAPFTVPRKPCFALIFNPLDGAVLPAEGTIALEGQGYWLESARPEWEQLEWMSSVDGALGSGRRLETRLSPGSHIITLLAGGEEYQGSATVAVVVEMATSA